MAQYQNVRAPGKPKKKTPLTLNGVLETDQLKDVWDIFQGTFPVVTIAKFSCLNFVFLSCFKFDDVSLSL